MKSTNTRPAGSQMGVAAWHRCRAARRRSRRLRGWRRRLRRWRAGLSTAPLALLPVRCRPRAALPEGGAGCAGRTSAAPIAVAERPDHFQLSAPGQDQATRPTVAANTAIGARRARAWPDVPACASPQQPHATGQGPASPAGRGRPCRCRFVGPAPTATTPPWPTSGRPAPASAAASTRPGRGKPALPAGQPSTKAARRAPPCPGPSAANTARAQAGALKVSASAQGRAHEGRRARAGRQHGKYARAKAACGHRLVRLPGPARR